jgi:pentatricopeptide repeat protein
LEYLIKSREEGVLINVDAVTFNGVMDAWAKSGRSKAPQRAEAVLKEMIEYSNAGWVEVTPNVVSYTTVLSTWANSNQAKAAHRAEELLHEMQQRGVSPNSISYLSVLTAWARSMDTHAPERAYAILKHMIHLHRQGVANVKPL